MLKTLVKIGELEIQLEHLRLVVCRVWELLSVGKVEAALKILDDEK